MYPVDSIKVSRLVYPPTMYPAYAIHSTDTYASNTDITNFIQSTRLLVCKFGFQ